MCANLLQPNTITPVYCDIVFKGEIFGGIHVASDQNDAKSLLNALDTCCSCDNNWHDKGRSCVGNGGKTVPEILSTIKGPWALIYWQV